MPGPNFPEDPKPRPKYIVPDDKLAGLANKVGFSKTKRVGGVGTELEIAVAVALGESTANSFAFNGNTNTGDRSYGLWQINMLDELGPERMKQFGLKAETDLFHPSVNARAAYTLYTARGNFRDWSVFKNGTYVPLIPRARLAVLRMKPWTSEDDQKAAKWLDDETVTEDETGLFSGVPGLEDLANLVGGLTNAFNFITDPKNWLRVAGFVGGGLVLLAGLVMAAKEMGVARAIPAGKVLRRVGKTAAIKGVTKAAEGVTE